MMYLIERLEHWAKQTPNGVAIKFQDQSFSFLEVLGKVENVTSYLRNELGVKAGNRVAYIGINHPNMLFILFACAHLGAIFSPLNSRLARDEYEYLIDNSDPVVCFYDENFLQIISEINSLSCSFVATEQLRKQRNRTGFENHHDPHEPLLLVYTSGTTGRPKGVLLSHHAVAVNIENGQHLYGFEPHQNVLVTLPLFHVGGLCILLLPALMHGATIHLHDRFDPTATISCLEEERITTSIFVPAQMMALMAHKQWETSDFSAMSHVVVGSSITPLAQIQAWHTRGVPVSQIYGATETGPIAIGLAIEDAMFREGAAGNAAKCCTIEIRNTDGEVCVTGESGEIWVQGANIFSGYWRDKVETDLVLQNGWYNTGDIGYRDEDGFYWIVDRSKDVIISGGENIYPAEIESVALQHPSIEAIAVVGKPDPRWGETPVAAIELKVGHSLRESEFRSFLEHKVAKFKHPKSILLFDKLPRNGMGKIEKTKIRDLVERS